MIYVVSVQSGKYVKVGFTNKTFEERIAQLQTGNPQLIKKVLTVEGTLIQEQELHKALKAAFTKCNIPIPNNEWYPGKHPMMQNFLQNLYFGCNAGLTFLDQYNPAIRRVSPKHGEPQKRYMWEKQHQMEKVKSRKHRKRPKAEPVAAVASDH